MISVDQTGGADLVLCVRAPLRMLLAVLDELAKDERVVDAEITLRPLSPETGPGPMQEVGKRLPTVTNGQAGSFGADGQEGSADTQHVDIAGEGGQLAETRAGETTGTSVLRHPVGAEPLDLMVPEGIPGALVTAAGVVRADGHLWECLCGQMTRTIGQMRQHRLEGDMTGIYEHGLIPVPTSVDSARHIARTRATDQPVSEPPPAAGVVALAAQHLAEQTEPAPNALDETARRTTAESACPLCGRTMPHDMADHLALDHRLAGRVVCACGKDYRTEGYHRTHARGVSDNRGATAAGYHRVMLDRDHVAPSAAVPVLASTRRKPSPSIAAAAAELAAKPRPPAVWVPAGVAPSRPAGSDEQDRLAEQRRRRAYEDTEFDL